MTDQPFEKRSPAAQQLFLRSSAEQVLARYAVEDPDVRLLQFEDNAVYLVKSAGRRYVLRMSVIDGRSPVEQASELAWMEALAADGKVLVPAPERARDGQVVVSSVLPGSREPVTSVLFEWVPGEPAPHDFPPGLATALGRATAGLHRHASAYRPPPWFTRPVWGHDEVFAAGATLTSRVAATRLSDADLAMLAEVSDRVARRLPERSPVDWGLVHADLHRGNVVRTPTGVMAVIDFDDCGWGYFMLDVATVLSSVLRIYLDDRAAYARFTANYFVGYRSVRELPPSAAAIDEFLAMRDMIILNFMLGSRNENVQCYAAARTGGILRLMREYLRTGNYDGNVPFTA
jgi:Ser/Thr protein kinase RdoA (MazF antagonist)